MIELKCRSDGFQHIQHSQGQISFLLVLFRCVQENEAERVSGDVRSERVSYIHVLYRHVCESVSGAAASQYTTRDQHKK